MFCKRQTSTDLNFGSRSEAFNYMLAYMIDKKGMEPLEAAQKANEFADIFAKNNNIPATIEPEPKGIDKYISMAEKIGNYIETHPKIVEYGVPALTFIVGLFTGKKVDDIHQQHIPEPPQQPQESIDFDKID